ncbi:MAG: hypothetical protein U0103_15230 [Candidatus Obscuribacterales bacterium]|nr:hypothetical protein [Cyanobacteria bacterium SZAS LIN-5]
MIETNLDLTFPPQPIVMLEMEDGKMFHKYDFGTASQITSRRWTNVQLEPEAPQQVPLAAKIVLLEIVAIAGLLIVPHFLQNATRLSEDGRGKLLHLSHSHKHAQHKLSAHLHQTDRRVG